MATTLGRRTCLATLALAAMPWTGRAATPPAGTRIVAAGPSGGPADFLARLFVETAGPLLREPISVHNKAGASGTLAAEEVARAAPDGHVLLVAGPAAITAAPHLLKLNYRPERDLVPVAMLGAGAFVLLVHPSVPANNVQELVALAARDPGGLTIASGGNGSAGHLCAELFARSLRVHMTHVAYKGESQAANDLLAGHVQVLFTAPSVVLAHAAQGRVRPLAVTTRHRVPALPQVPTVAETVLPRFEYLSWMVLFAPAGTPPERISSLRHAWDHVRKLPEVAGRLQALGMHAPDDLLAGAPLRAFLHAESERQRRLIHQLGLKPE